MADVGVMMAPPETVTELQRLFIRETVREVLEVTRDDRRRETEEIVYRVLESVRVADEKRMDAKITVHRITCLNKRMTAVIALGSSVLTGLVVAVLMKYAF